MKKIFALITVLCLIYSLTYAQEPKTKRELRKIKVDELVKHEEEGVITSKKHFLGGLKITTDGYGIFFEKGISKSLRKSFLFQLDISERRHQKEDKIFDERNSEPYIYGKVNYFYPVKLGTQLQYLLGNKGNKNGVAVYANFGGGLDLALLRPYEMRVEKDGSQKYIQYKDDNEAFLNGPYSGSPRFGTGWNHLSIVPGVYLKPAIRFDFAKTNDAIYAVEVGILAEGYSKKIQQMALNKEEQFFISGFISIIFGSRK